MNKQADIRINFEAGKKNNIFFMMEVLFNYHSNTLSVGLIFTFFRTAVDLCMESYLLRCRL